MSTNNFHLLNKGFNQMLELEFEELIIDKEITIFPPNLVLPFIKQKCNEARIEENQKWINMIEGRQRTAIDKLDLKKFDHIGKGNLEYRIRILDGTTERTSAGKEDESCKMPEMLTLSVPKSCIPEGAKLVECYKHKGEYIIIGEPEDETDENNPKHNCDAMGCGSLTHVLARVKEGEQ